MFLPPQKPHGIFGTDIKKSRTNGILFFAVFKSCSLYLQLRRSAMHTKMRGSFAEDKSYSPPA